MNDDTLATTSAALSRMRERAQEQRNCAGDPPPCETAVEVSICKPPALPAGEPALEVLG